MQFYIQAKGFFSPKAREAIPKRTKFAPHRNDKHILRACIRLADINGSRGRVDKRCQIELKLAGQDSIVIEDTKANLYFAIDRACN